MEVKITVVKIIKERLREKHILEEHRRRKEKKKTLRVLEGFFHITDKETETELAPSYLFLGLLQLRPASG